MRTSVMSLLVVAMLGGACAGCSKPPSPETPAQEPKREEPRDTVEQVAPAEKKEAPGSALDRAFNDMDRRVKGELKSLEEGCDVTTPTAALECVASLYSVCDKQICSSKVCTSKSGTGSSDRSIKRCQDKLEAACEQCEGNVKDKCEEMLTAAKEECAQRVTKASDDLTRAQKEMQGCVEEINKAIEESKAAQAELDKIVAEAKSKLGPFGKELEKAMPAPEKDTSEQKVEKAEVPNLADMAPSVDAVCGWLDDGLCEKDATTAKEQPKKPPMVNPKVMVAGCQARVLKAKAALGAVSLARDQVKKVIDALLKDYNRAMSFANSAYGAMVHKELGTVNSCVAAIRVIERKWGNHGSAEAFLRCYNDIACRTVVASAFSQCYAGYVEEGIILYKQARDEFGLPAFVAKFLISKCAKGRDVTFSRCN